MHNNILIDLDTLFDTRTTVLKSVTTEEQFVAILDAGYGNRECDRYDTIIPYETYLEAYEKRNNAVLQKSTISMIIPIVKKMLKDAMDAYIETPITKMPKLFIQVPLRYTLTEEEKLDIGRFLIHHLDMDIPIAFVERNLISLRDLNAMEVGIYYLYDAIQWIADMTVDCVIDHKMLSPGTVVCAAKVHTSAAPYNRQALDKATAVIKSEMDMVCKFMFIPALYFTTPIIASLHLPQNQ